MAKLLRGAALLLIAWSVAPLPPPRLETSWGPTTKPKFVSNFAAIKEEPTIAKQRWSLATNVFSAINRFKRKDGSRSRLASQKSLDDAAEMTMRLLNELRSLNGLDPITAVKKVHEVETQVVEGTLVDACMSIELASGDVEDVQVRDVQVRLFKDLTDIEFKLIRTSPPELVWGGAAVDEDDSYAKFQCAALTGAPATKANRVQPPADSDREHTLMGGLEMEEKMFGEDFETGASGNVRASLEYEDDDGGEVDEEKSNGQDDEALGAFLQMTEEMEIPAAYDARNVDDGRCRHVIEKPYSQGGCGSCYAFAAMSAAAARMCLGNTMPNYEDGVQAAGLAVHDALACGTKQAGKACMVTVNEFNERELSRNYANGCDGGQPYKVFEYAADKGVVPLECHDHEYSGDPVTHFTANDPKCVLTVHGPSPVEIGCGRMYLMEPLQPGTPTIVPIEMCTCSVDKRSWAAADKVEVKVEEDHECRATPTTNNPTKLTCGCSKTGPPGDCPVDGMHVAVGLPGNSEGAHFTIPMKFCRCPERFRHFSGASVAERGDGATQECRRKTPPEPLCQPTKMYDPVQFDANEDLIKRAILHGGPVVKSMKTFRDMQELRGNGVYRRDPASEFSGHHAIVLFGWGTDEQSRMPFWWAKNSWGVDWPKDCEDCNVLDCESPECDVTPSIFRIYRGEIQEGERDVGIDHGSVSWAYAHPGQATVRGSYCAAATEEGPDGCLKVERDRELEKCMVTNQCIDKEIEFKMHHQPGKGLCGSQYTSFPNVRPGSTVTQTDVLDCCIKDEKVAKAYRAEPGKCIRAKMSSAGQCLMQNICGYNVELIIREENAPTINFAHYFEVDRKAGSLFFGKEYNYICGGGSGAVDMYSSRRKKR